jgi:hypothetical protein
VAASTLATTNATLGEHIARLRRLNADASGRNVPAFNRALLEFAYFLVTLSDVEAQRITLCTSVHALRRLLHLRMTLAT